jgi:hypothetical protein
VARTGTDGPIGPNLGPGITFLSFEFESPRIDGVGNAAFGAQLAGTGVTNANRFVLYATVNGSPAIAARTGAGETPGPGVGGDASFSSNPFFTTHNFGANGEISLHTLMTGTGITFFNNDRGQFKTSGGGSPAIYARNGVASPGPNLGANVFFSSFPDGPALINPSGNTAFRAFLTGSGTSSSDNSAIFTNIGGVVAASARKGSTTLGPGLGGSVFFDSFTSLDFNAAGTTLFSATLSGNVSASNNNVIAIDTVAATPAVVARTGVSNAAGPNMGAGVTFTQFITPHLNGAGKVAFFASIAGPGITSANDDGLFSNASGSMKMIARTGAVGAAAGLGPNLGPNITFIDFAGAAQNTSGKAVIAALLTGPGVDNTNDGALFYADAANNGALIPIVREGDLFDVDPGPGVDNRQIADIVNIWGGNGESGTQASFNDAGLLVFRMEFTDFSTGIFTVTVPEPAIGLALLSASALLAPRRRAR